MLIHGIDLVNTHSSRDAWVGGVAARLARARLIRTRHLSTPIRPGVNSRLLYGWLADAVVTTSQKMVPIICRQAHLKSELCRSIPTGVSPLTVSPEEVRKFREGLGLKEGDLLIGTACVVRSWKGIPDFLQSALLLKGDPRLKWVIVGGGHLDQYPLPKELEGVVTFTGHLESPYAAIAAMDVFLLLSTASEGVSQAALQAAYLGRPLVTTDVGGLSEVCLDGRTGILVPPRAPDKVSRAVADLAGDPALRERFGAMGRRLVEERFMLGGMLDQLEELYRLAFR
jgi:glycosyltransferase involved in cell wall biosynthesis